MHEHEQKVRDALAAAELVADKQDIAQLTDAYSTLRQMANRLCRLTQPDMEPELIFSLDN